VSAWWCGEETSNLTRVHGMWQNTDYATDIPKHLTVALKGDLQLRFQAVLQNCKGERRLNLSLVQSSIVGYPAATRFPFIYTNPRVTPLPAQRPDFNQPQTTSNSAILIDLAGTSPANYTTVQYTLTHFNPPCSCRASLVFSARTSIPPLFTLRQSSKPPLPTANWTRLLNQFMDCVNIANDLAI
jgi:hypothetical protein